MSKLLFSNDDLLVINPKLAKLIGLNEAIILQQIHYWIDNKNCKGVHAKGRKWIYNTVSQWQEQFPFLSPSTIKRTMLELRNLDLISIEQLSENSRDTTNYYAINYEKLDSLQTVQSEPPREVNLNSLDGSNWSPPNRTETTTETTSINTEKKEAGRRKKTVEKPSDVSEQIWEDWLQLRKTKKAPVTQTALDGIAREAKKAGYTLEQALEACCSNGWQGFKAEWVLRSNQQAGNATQRPPMKTFEQQRREEGWANWEKMSGRTHPDRLAAQAPQRDLIDITPRGDSLYLE